VKYHATYEDKKEIYFVMEYCPRGVQEDKLGGIKVCKTE
jgi:hypothetical protein